MEKENGPGATENGTAIFKFHLKGNDPAGQWQAQAIANQIGVTGSNMTTFTVQEGERYDHKLAVELARGIEPRRPPRQRLFSHNNTRG